VNGLDGIIKQLEAQKTAIDEALAALKDLGGEMSGGSAPAPSTPGVDRRSAGQKARWAAKRAAEATPAAPAAPVAKHRAGISAAGRRKLAEAMKRRWAAKRAAAPAKKSGRSKKST